MRAEVSLRGDKLKQQLVRLKDAFPMRIIGQALKEEAVAIAWDSISMTPIRTGNLRRSHRIIGPYQSEGYVHVSIGVGGGPGSGNLEGNGTNELPVWYAVNVHENLDSYHPVGQAKFLETAVNTVGRGFQQRVGARIRELMEEEL